MSNVRINAIGREHGREAALAYAIVSQASYNTRRAIENGTWSFDEKRGKPAKTEPKVATTQREVRQVVDRVADKRIVKVSLGAEFLGYQIEVLGESGDVVSREGLGKLSLAEARALIGKLIAYPVKTGGKTNDPKLSQSMKGSSTGGGNKGGKKGK